MNDLLVEVLLTLHAIPHVARLVEEVRSLRQRQLKPEVQLVCEPHHFVLAQAAADVQLALLASLARKKSPKRSAGSLNLVANTSLGVAQRVIRFDDITGHGQCRAVIPDLVADHLPGDRIAEVIPPGHADAIHEIGTQAEQNLLERWTIARRYPAA